MVISHILIIGQSHCAQRWDSLPHLRAPDFGKPIIHTRNAMVHTVVLTPSTSTFP